MEVRRFQVVILGAGPAGLTAAFALAKGGVRVAIIDENAYGGTCLNRGCDPKKILRAGAELAHRAKNLARDGIVEPAPINWERLIEKKRRMTRPEEVEENLARAGVTVIHGRASFLDENTVRVASLGLIADRFIIATGARERTLTITGAEHLATSHDVLDFDALPEHALFIGGGYVSFELAHILNACGVACTIIHNTEHPLPDFDETLVRTLIESSREDGIDIILGSDVTGIEPVGKGYHVHAQDGHEHHTYETDVAIHGAGREPNITHLNLAAAGIRASEGIDVDEYLRATETIYAIGDCTTLTPKLTPTAQLQARCVVRTLLGNATTYDETIIPTVLFTLPELASVGLTLAQARESKASVRVENHEMSTWYSSTRIGQSHAGARIIIDSNDLIVGAHLFGEGAQETIHLFALAMREGITASALKDLTYAFPTHSSDIPSLL